MKLLENRLYIQYGSILIEAQQTVNKDASNLPEEKVDERPYQSNECKKSYETKITVQAHSGPINAKNARRHMEQNLSFNVTQELFTNRLSPLLCQQCKLACKIKAELCQMIFNKSLYLCNRKIGQLPLAGLKIVVPV